MVVLELIDRLHHLVPSAKRVPLGAQVRVNAREIRDLLDQMRATIQGEIKQACWIVQERQTCCDPPVERPRDAR